MLELYFRKYGWTANALLLFLAAWLSAKTVNTIVGAAIRPKPSVDLGASAGGARASAGATRVPLSSNASKLFPLIGQPVPEIPVDVSLSAGPGAVARTCTDALAAPVKSGLGAQLVASILSEVPEWSLATITDSGSRETRVYGIGDTVLGATIISIEAIRDEGDPNGPPRAVCIICNNGQKEYLDSTGGGGPAPTSAPNLGTSPVPAPSGGAPAVSLEGITSKGGNKYDVKRATIDGVLGNLNTIATQGRIVPSFENGVSNGFKVFSIQKNSLWSAIGVQNGDVISRINGYEINSPEKALEIYGKLRESRSIQLEGKRNGQPFRMEYTITP
jgi:general secretion pathway protein C